MSSRILINYFNILPEPQTATVIQFHDENYNINEGSKEIYIYSKEGDSTFQIAIPKNFFGNNPFKLFPEIYGTKVTSKDINDFFETRFSVKSKWFRYSFGNDQELDDLSLINKSSKVVFEKIFKQGIVFN